MVLYHGTDQAAALHIQNQGINLTAGHKYVDFGQGFYTTTDRKTAEARAIHKAYDSLPAVICLEFDIATAKKYIHEVQSGTVAWGQFIVNNRNGWEYVNDIGSDYHNLSMSYDIVCGQISDGNNIMQICRQIAYEHRLVNSADVAKMLAKRYPVHYSFHTKTALSFLSIQDIRIMRKGVWR